MPFILWGYTEYQLTGPTMAIASPEEQCNVPTKSLEELYASQPVQSPSSLCFRKLSVMDRKASFVTLGEVKMQEKSALQRGKEEPRWLPQETPQPELQERESTDFANSKGK